VNKVLSLVFTNDLKDLPDILRVVKTFLEPHRLDGRLIYAVDLVLEEAISNIINHGYEDDQSHDIEVRIAVQNKQVAIKLEDDGIKFNPLSVPRFDTSQRALDRLEGGLGIHLVRNMMNSMAYRRENNRNIFEIWIYC
jgi:serine/threonine-protein kinase RsbW